jgi:hypothetical protein
VLARAESLLELSPTPQQGKMKVLAGARTPQLVRPRRTCSMRPMEGACHITDMLRAQKTNGVTRNSKEITYTKSYHSQLPRAFVGTLFPAEDPPDLWWRSPAAGASGGGGRVCGLGSVGGGGIAGRRVVGGSGGICCSGEGRRASSSCWRCGGGGGALLCLSASAIF